LTGESMESLSNTVIITGRAIAAHVVLWIVNSDVRVHLIANLGPL